MLLIKTILITHDEYCAFGKAKEIDIDFDKFSIKAQVCQEFNLTHFYYLELYTDNESLFEMSKLQCQEAKEFIQNIIDTVKQKLIEDETKLKEKEEKESHEKYLELLKELS